MRKKITKALLKVGFSISRISKDLSIPVELSKEEVEFVFSVKNEGLSMCSLQNLFHTALACIHVAKNDIQGDFVECGVYKGGNALIAAQIFKSRDLDKKIILFDTFKGMTKPIALDVKNFTEESASVKFAKLHLENYNEWCYSSLLEVKSNFKVKNLLSDNIIFVAGDVNDTLGNTSNLPSAISVLRLDTDWYQSTKKELEVLYPKLSPGGVLIIDDYGSWQGAKKATDDYFKHEKIFFSQIDDGARISVKH
jgi:O-methyltransferase